MSTASTASISVSNVAVLSSKGSENQAINLGNKLDLPVKNQDDDLADYLYSLQFIDNKLCLATKDLSVKPICVDFCSDKLLYRIKHGGGRSELIAKATLVNKIDSPVIIDATAGLGKDSFIMASLGAKVKMIERSNIIHALLENALESSKQNANIAHITSNMQLVNQDAYDYISNLQDIVDVIYLDPMFPLRKKSSLVKKEMVVFKDIVGQDADADRLLDIAIKKANKRVVVKRPATAPYLNNKKPDITYKGKANRFDVYSVVLPINKQEIL